MSAAPLPALEVSTVCATLVSFLREEFRRAGFDRAVLGLSGGIDSAVVCYLAVEALGADAVTTVLMPAHSSNPNSLADARAIVEATGVRSRLVPIGDMAETYLSTVPEASLLRRGNVYARCRMIVLWDVSAEVEGLVLGTSNRTEILLGYGTLHGDLAAAINPLGDLYKTQVRALAAHLGVPESVRTKPPTADLWEGQSDEEELGATYEQLDALLPRLIDERATPDRLVELGFDAAFVRSVTERVRSNRFKGRLPIIAKVDTRTIGRGPRSPRGGDPDENAGAAPRDGDAAQT